MPHGGYHGTVKIGNNVVQTASQNPNTGQYEISGGIDDSSRLDFNPPQSNQNNQNINQQIENKKKEIEAINDLQEGTFEPMFTDDGRMFGTMTTGTQGVDAKGLATLQNFQNQQLDNLMKKEQEEALRTIMLGDAKAGQLQKENLLGYKGGLFGLNTGPNIGGTTYPDFAYQGFDGTGEYFNQKNPFTGERIRTVKAREGLSTPDYNKFISELYDANPELYQETFPFASGQIAKPIFARIGEGIMNLPGASEIGQMGGDILNAMISPISGIFSGKKTTTPKIQYDNMGNPVGITSQSPESDGGDFDITAPKLDLGQYSAIPEEYKGFFESEFAKPVAGGMAITYVTLPDGSKVKFGDTGSAAQFRKYLESIGAIKSESTEDYPKGYGAFLLNPPDPVRPGSPTIQGFPDQDGDGVDDRYQAGPGISRPGTIDSVLPLKPKTNLPAAFNYASIAPQFTGSQYTNQGVSPAFLENLRRFYG